MHTPLDLGYHFPAEWGKHYATWLTWPYLDDSFPGKLEDIYIPYIQFIKEIVKGEKVRINIPNEIEQKRLFDFLNDASIDISR